MSVDNTLVVGTIGYGVFWTKNDGLDWDRSNFVSGLPFGTRVYYLASHPHKPEIIFAGTDFGLARSEDAGKAVGNRRKRPVRLLRLVAGN